MNKPNEKKNFFCICDKCGNKVLQHSGFKEHPKGNFIFFVKCKLCGHEFNHRLTSTKALQKEQFERATNAITQKGIRIIADKFMKGDNDGGF